MFLQQGSVSFSPLWPQMDAGCQPEFLPRPPQQCRSARGRLGARAGDTGSPFLSWSFCCDLAVTSWVNVCHRRNGVDMCPAASPPAHA